MSKPKHQQSKFASNFNKKYFQLIIFMACSGKMLLINKMETLINHYIL